MAEFAAEALGVGAEDRQIILQRRPNQAAVHREVTVGQRDGSDLLSVLVKSSAGFMVFVRLRQDVKHLPRPAHLRLRQGHTHLTLVFPAAVFVAYFADIV